MGIRRAIAAAAALAAGLATVLVVGPPAAVAAPALPAGFVLTDSASGLAAGDLLTDFDYLPDGSVLSTGKNGKVAWASADRRVTRVIATIPVVTAQDVGLIGLAVARDYETSRRIYVTGAHPVTGTYVLRVTEWTVTGGAEPTGLTGARTVLEVPARDAVHALTGVVAAADGTLWVSIGDLVDPGRGVQPTNMRPLDRNAPEGKLLHITPDGRGVPGNPFYDAANPTSWRSRVYALGFRSPFRLSLDPRSGAPIVGDVGWNSFEEINLVRPGASYGWPCWEGNQRTIGYRDLPSCAGVGHSPPLWTYDRSQGASVTGGVIYTGDRYPAAYRGAYFFGDYTSHRLWTMQIDPQGRIARAPEAAGFGNSIGGPVKFGTGPNGDIVFADILSGKLRRLSYTPGNRPPTASAVTSTNPATRTVTFDAGRSFDPDGDPLGYRWDFGDGTSGQGVTVSHTYAAGVETATARLTVNDPAGAVDTLDITVAPANNPPQLTLTGPPVDRTFAVNDVVEATATAVDVEDGPLTVHWTTTLVHCRGTSCHDHPGRTFDGPAYAEPFANHEDDTRMEITASATDSRGVTTSRTFEAKPRLRTLTLLSNPPAPMTITGAQRNVASVIANATISFSAAATAADGVATFDRWSDGGPQVRTGFTMPDADVTLTATYLTPIDRRYASDPALPATVGTPTAAEQGTATLRWREYTAGRVYWTPAAGVREVHGSILGTFLAHGGHDAFGAPTTDETRTPDGTGRYNHFAGGAISGGLASIYWTPSTGAHAVYGQIRIVWARYGYERGLGYPTTDELGTPDGIGRFNHFSAGASIYWTPSTGAHEVHGSIRVVWERTGWEYGLGYPTTDELGTPDGIGRYNHFSKGGSIYWSPSTGAHEIYGAIKTRWAQLGWERSYLGYPTSGEFAVSGGRRSNFQHGYIVWYSATGQVVDRRY
jgi:glucose/arabinose dehydrogenase